MITYITNDHGYDFPSYNGELLSWSIGASFTDSDREQGYPRTRIVIRAMQEKRPDMLEKERTELLKSALADRVFGPAAKRLLHIIEEETR